MGNGVTLVPVPGPDGYTHLDGVGRGRSHGTNLETGHGGDIRLIVVGAVGLQEFAREERTAPLPRPKGRRA